MKQGLDYLCLDVALDEKFDLIEAEFGLTGFAVIVKLYQRIYGGEGYYCEWTNEVALLFASKIHVGDNVVSEIVSAAIRRGIFNKEKFDKYGILTSSGIQKRCFEAVRRRKFFEVDPRYLLLSVDILKKNVNISIKNVNISCENVDISEQSKVKESKVKESKRESNIKRDIRAPAIPPLTAKKATDIGTVHPPTLKEVEEYIKEQGIAIDPARFWGYYDVRNWMLSDGTDLRLKWKSMILAWKGKEKQYARKDTSDNGTSGEATFDVNEFFEASLNYHYQR